MSDSTKVTAAGTRRLQAHTTWVAASEELQLLENTSFPSFCSLLLFVFLLFLLLLFIIY